MTEQEAGAAEEILAEPEALATVRAAAGEASEEDVRTTETPQRKCEPVSNSGHHRGRRAWGATLPGYLLGLTTIVAVIVEGIRGILLSARGAG